MSQRVSISTEPRDEEEAPGFDQPRRGRGDLPPLDTSDTQSSSSSPPASPGFEPSDSTAALILVHDDEEERDTGFDFAYDSSGEDDEEDDDGVPQGQPAVSPFMTFVYLLSPGLKLGALLLPATAGTTLSRRVTSVVACAALSMIARHVWYMLTRYYWKGAKGDIGRLIIHAFTSTRGSTLARRRYRRIESVLRICRWTVGVLMAGVYVRESATCLLRTIAIHPILINVLLTCAVVPFVMYPANVASKTVKSTTVLSIFSYIVWFSLQCYTFTHSTGPVEPQQLGVLYNPLSIPLLAYATTPGPLLSLYASLKVKPRHHVHFRLPTSASTTSDAGISTKKPRFHFQWSSFKVLSALAMLFSLGLTLPIAMLVAGVERKAARMTFSPDPVIALTGALSLYFGIPLILTSIPTLAFPTPASLRRALPPASVVSRVLTVLAIALVALVPLRWPLNDALLVLVALPMYFLPAILHITTHFIKRPMAIVAPQTPRALPGSTDGAHSPLTPDESALLQRKEHALQLKLLKRRLVWDVLVCGVLVPASLGGLAWVVYAIVESFR
ncbi:uncharacterized protein SCHCODRAFT_02570023 [Schizophyllum commune H4-8]|uniref:uncharacterized protein n=1 Tax=Schizophyllum commune (strain H4-8 / FGSC 9210) TaxID=578458 RepID=UPI0021607279|nr:uncharacterized protein SCHCODRAFT_02570023 [Schizophyllum commune H4-8]KAI5896873.1 hypothetical protein SCHCODRAFT_02570023 [Schizophyllum commune H4-8]